MRGEPNVKSANIEDLRRAAEANGVTTSYWDALGTHHEVPPSTLEAVLAGMGVDPRDPAGPADTAWPPVVVVRAGRPPPPLPDSRFRLLLESGEERALDGGLPEGLPLGYHSLVGETGRTRLVVAPDRCWLPPVADGGGHAWGWSVQLYALRSRASWGIGDLRDLRELLGGTRDAGPAARPGRPRDAAAAGDRVPSPHRSGPAFALLNPLHDASAADASPYFPSTRLFRNPLYLHVEAVPEVGRLELLERTRLEQLVTAGRRLNQAALIDRQAVHGRKDEALRLCHAALARDPERQAAFAAWRASTPQVDRYATFCALQRVHGADWRAWPAALRDPSGPEVARFAADHDAEIGYHAYLQWLLDEQLGAAAAQAGEGRIGIVNDLAVGFAPHGFDAWTFAGDLAPGITVGAPPDELGPQGQDWGVAALAPTRLAASAYEPFTQTIRAGMAHAGGLRIDHVMGMFRLFWIPEGAPPAAGTYVGYPAEDLLGVLALESWRARALVVGEDLGTVEPGVRERLAAERVLSSRVAWFERDGRGPRPAAEYPRLALATVTTHDLPTTHGFLSDADLYEQRRLGLVPPGRWDGALAAHQAARAGLHALLEREGLLKWWEHDLDTVTGALYAFLARTPALLVGVSLDDVLGTTGRPNVPGTLHQRPNWSVPLPLELEELLVDPRVKRVVELLHPGGASGGES